MDQRQSHHTQLQEQTDVSAVSQKLSELKCTHIEDEPFEEITDDECDLDPLERLQSIRKLMQQRGIGIYLVTAQDEHQSEYVADADRRMRYITNFSGSAGMVSIGREWAELATDSRYTIIARREMIPEWEVRETSRPGVEPWDDAVIRRAIEEKVDVGVDPKFFRASIASKMQIRLEMAGQKLVAVPENLVDLVWGPAKPPLPDAEITSLPLKFSGETAESKITRIRESLSAKGAASLVVYGLEDIAWALNLRGGDIPYVPVFKSYMIITADEVTLYVDQDRHSLDLSDHEGLEIVVKDYTSFYTDVAHAPKPALLPGDASWEVHSLVHDPRDYSGPQVSPVALLRAIKNKTEIKGIREAQLKCSISICRYLAWLDYKVNQGEEITEYEGALRLLKFRKELPNFMGNSFETISSAGPNAAAPHYAPDRETARNITKEEIYLLDSGSHFLEGSTDITRTVRFSTPRRKEIVAYTDILKGHIAFTTSVFPEGTSGLTLDYAARQFLWKDFMNYGHGSGHGIGSYLNVHENPGIGMTGGPESQLRPGQLVTIEPGYYREGKFGIRIESDLLVKNVAEGEDGDAGRGFLTFEYLTSVPFERKLLDVGSLTVAEITFINNYHARCRRKLMCFLKRPREIEWLLKQTEPLPFPRARYC